jgi:RNA polymerase sigma factor (sigma-70 family)
MSRKAATAKNAQLATAVSQKSFSQQAISRNDARKARAAKSESKNPPLFPSFNSSSSQKRSANPASKLGGNKALTKKVISDKLGTDRKALPPPAPEIQKRLASKKPFKKLTKTQYAKIIVDHYDSSIRLAWSMLNRFRVRLPADEVQSVTGAALCEAATRFDKSLGVSFRTFLFYHLRGLLLREISRKISESRLSTSLDNTDSMTNAARSQESVLWPQALVETHTPENLVVREQISKQCWDACDNLDELEKEVLIRFFVNDQTVADIAKDLGYCRCHVSRVKSKALATLQKRLSHLSPETAEREDSDDMPRLSSLIKKGSYRGGRGRRRIQKDEAPPVALKLISCG